MNVCYWLLYKSGYFVFWILTLAFSQMRVKCRALFPVNSVEKAVLYGGRESSMRCNFRKHMQIEKAPTNQENIFISLTADGANAHNTNK